MEHYKFKPISVTKAEIEVTYSDKSTATYMIDLYDAYVQIHNIDFADEFSAWKSSIFIHFRDLGDQAGNVIFVTVLAVLGQFGIVFSKNHHGNIDDRIQDWCREYAKTL